MTIKAAEKDFPAIIGLWELSVRATHDFLPENYLQEIKAMLPVILPQVDIYIFCDNDTPIKGFAGVADKKIEMLFIHPDYHGQGIGRQITEFCIQTLSADKVDVNEQNDHAVEFYKHLGFIVTGRTELDGQGNPFPLLQMELKK